jgi:undecaprenyl phosphate-alpha-L-ara4N flippase subunit ArnE
MPRVLIILLLALVIEAVGVVMLSRGLKQIGQPEQFSATEVWRFVRRGAGNPSLLAGVALETVFFGALIYLLSQRDVSLVWPLTALGFVLTTLAARFLLHEQVHWIRWVGVCLIVGGAVLVSYSERLKSPAPPESLPPGIQGK